MTSKSHARRPLIAVGVLALAACGSNPAPPAPPEPSAAAPAAALVAPADVPPIVYASNRPGTYQLYATGPERGEEVRVTDRPAMYPAWSPDGRRLVFAGEVRTPDAEPDEHDHGGEHAEAGSAGTRVELSRVEPDGTITSLLAGAQVPSHPTVRADGTVAYQSTLLDVSEAAGVKGRSTIDSIDGTRRTVVRHRGAAYQPAWSPDGRRLAVVLGNPGCRSKRLCRQRLVLVEPRRTLIAGGSAAAPAWSPDGASIAFTWDRGGGPSVWTLRVSDGALRRVTHGRGDSEPTWSPDGRRIAFMRRCDIFVVGVDGRRPANLTRSRDTCEISPAWRPSG